MKKYYFFILITLFIFSDCNLKEKEVKQETIRQIIGTWTSDYNKGSCQYVEITFNDDMTGYFTYTDSSNISENPPFNFTWDIISEKCDCDNGEEFSSFLKITRSDANRYTINCDSLKYLKEILAYRIGSINSEQIELITTGQLPWNDIFNPTETGMLPEIILYRKK